MKKKGLTNSLFVASAALLLITATAAVAAPGVPMSDEWVGGRIQGALSYNNYLDSSDLSVDFKKGNAVLSGVVASETERELAEQITRGIDGVTEVENRVKVDPEVAMRSRPERVQRGIDATTTAAVKTRLFANKNMHDKDIKVTTKNGVVALSGSVDSLSQRESAENIALNTRDVRDVTNDLKIADPVTMGEKASNASQSISRDVSDSWITSKIRSSLFFSSGFAGSDVSVKTTNGTVTLDGHARSNQQRDEIEKMVNEFVGVRAVDNRLKAKQQS